MATMPPQSPTSTAIDTPDGLPPTTLLLGNRRSFQMPPLMESRTGRQSFDVGRSYKSSLANQHDSALVTSRPSLDCKTGRRSVDIHKLAQLARGSQGGRSRSSSKSGHVTDLERISHMLNLITKGRPLDVVLQELKEKKAMYHGMNSKIASEMLHKSSASWTQNAVSRPSPGTGAPCHSLSQVRFLD